MVNVRPESAHRLNVLLTEDREHAIEHWTRQLPRLLEPQGIHARVARTGREALLLADEQDIHAAVIDLLTPRGEDSNDRYPGGLWLLEMFRRLPNRPPVVVVNNENYSWRQAQRCLNEALRLGAFSVVNRPVEIDVLLEVIRRLVDRRYAGTWPTSQPGGSGPAPSTDRSRSDSVSRSKHPLENPAQKEKLK